MVDDSKSPWERAHPTKKFPQTLEATQTLLGFCDCVFGASKIMLDVYVFEGVQPLFLHPACHQTVTSMWEMVVKSLSVICADSPGVLLMFRRCDCSCPLSQGSDLISVNDQPHNYGMNLLTFAVLSEGLPFPCLEGAG